MKGPRSFSRAMAQDRPKAGMDWGFRTFSTKLHRTKQRDLLFMNS